MPDTRRRIRSQARPALMWTLIFFLGGHLILGAYLVHCYPELCDPEFHLRLDALRARIEAAPERPLALMLGSSRVAFGMRPAAVMAATNDPVAPQLFNFAMLGVGPVGERLVLHRALEMGLNPKWVFLEVWPPFLPQSGFSNEEDIIFRRDFYCSDLPAISHLYRRRSEAAGRVFAETVTPALHYRQSVLNRCAPCLLPRTLRTETEFNDLLRFHLDGFGWVPFNLGLPDPAGLETHIQRAKLMTKPQFDRFAIHPISDRALHEMLEECQSHGIRAAILLMPEHSLLRGWYPPMQAKLTAYLGELSEQYRAPVIDARTWSGDADIPDCCHLSPEGARVFSARFGRDVYGPLMRGQPLPANLLLCGSARP